MGLSPAGGKIRVLHLIEHLRIGGAERVVVNLVTALDGEKIESTVCHYRHRGLLAGDLEKKGFSVVYMEKDFLSRPFSGFFRILLFPVVLLESAVFVFRLRKLMKKMKADIVHSHIFSANLWGRIAALLAGGAAVVTTEHTKYIRDTSVKHAVLNRMLMPMTDRVVAISEEVARAVEEQQRVPRGRMAVIPNGIPLPPRSAAGGAEGGGPPVIASVGRLVPEKRHDILLEAVKESAAEIGGLQCWIVGDGPERRKIEGLITGLGLQDTVQMLGERRDVPALFPRMTVVVNSSEREGLPLSLLEAMGAGIPVVATDAGGNREIVRDGETGFLVPSEDHGALARGICRLITDRELAREMAERARSLVEEKHSVEAAAKRYEALYGEVCREKAGFPKRGEA